MHEEVGKRICRIGERPDVCWREQVMERGKKEEYSGIMRGDTYSDDWR